MSYYNNLRKKHLETTMDNLISVENIYINIAVIAMITMVGARNVNRLTSVLSICIAMLGILVLFMSMIKRKVSNTDGLSLTGIAFGTAATFYILLVSIKLEAASSMDMELKLLTAASYMQATGVLLAFLFRKIKLDLRAISSVFCSAAICIQMLIFYDVPKNFVLFNNVGYTALKDYLDVGLVLYYLLILVVILLRRKMVEIENVSTFYIFILLNVVAELERVILRGSSDITSLAAQIIKILAYVTLYKILVSNKIKKPMEELYRQVNDSNYVLGMRNRTLQETVEELEKQIISRKRYERKLRYAEEKYQKIVDNSPEAIYIQEGNEIVFMNRAARNFFALGHTEKLTGISIFSMIEGDNLEIMQERLRLTQVEKQDCEPIEILCHCFDGTTKVLEITDIYINLEGKSVTLSIGMDVTIKRRMEEDGKRLKEAMEYEKIRSNFFSNISHELRTPVNLIYSSLQVIDLYREYNSSDDKSVDYHATMKQNCLRLIRIINNIIDITKMDSGYYVPSYSRVEIVSLFEDMTEAVIRYTREKEKHIIFDTDIEEKEMFADRELLERMFLNLLSNAVKFCGENGNIEVHLSNREEGIEVRVKDYGVGIPEQHLPNIFDKFTQVDKSIRRGNEGSGLGLAIAKSIVDIHGGTININSTLGAGSTIVVFIPDQKLHGYNGRAYIEAAATSIASENCGIGQTDCVECGLCNKIEKECIDKVSLEFSDIYF